MKTQPTSPRPSQQPWSERVPVDDLDGLFADIEPIQPAQCPWKARVGDRSESIVLPRPLEDFLNMPFPGAMLGAALYSGQSQLLINTQILLNEGLGGDERRIRTRSADLLYSLWQMDITDQDLYTLFFYLLIEPFALMDQYDKGAFELA